MTHPPDYFILRGKVPVLCKESQWRKWIEKNHEKSIVKSTRASGVEVVTHFRGHDPAGGIPPLLFLTTVYGGEFDGKQWRTMTWQEAEQQHRQVVRDVIGMASV